MGTNKRYASHYDGLMRERITETIAAKGALQSLTGQELSLDTEALTVDPKPRAVKAWVRFGDTPVQVNARACRWTSRAVGLEFEIRGRVFRTWVWVGAVTDDIEPRPLTDEQKYRNAG